MRALVLSLLAAACIPALGEPTQGVLHFTVNGQDKGAIPAWLSDEGKWLIRDAELLELGIHTTQPPQTVEGQPYYPLAALKGVSATIDEATLTAALTADPGLLDRQTVTLLPANPVVLTPPAAFSGFMNYQLGLYTDKDTHPSVALDGAVRSFDWLLDGTAFYQKTDISSLTKAIKLTREWPERMLRLEIGDLPAQSNIPGQSLAMRGVSVSRAFDTQPYFQRAPGMRFSGSVGVPAAADVMVDGVRVRTVQLNPGTFDINSLAYRTGLLNAVVVLRDSAGNILSQTGGPTYIPSIGLAKGVSDFGMSVGRIADGAQQDSLGYASRYAFGLSDQITAGALAQGEGKLRYAGGVGTLTAGLLGTISGQVVKASGDGAGMGTNIDYVWQAPHLSVNVSSQSYAQGFFGRGTTTTLSGLDSISGLALPQHITTATLSYFMVNGRGISASVASRKYQDNTQAKAFSLSYTYHIGNLNIMAMATRAIGNAAEAGTTASINLNWFLGNNRYANAYFEKNLTGPVTHTDVSQIPVDDEGFGYRMSLQADNARLAYGYVQYGLANALISATASSTGKDTSGAAFLSSSVAMVDNEIRTARKSGGSFVIADIGLPNVHVRRNNQTVGVTGEDGKLLIPYLSAYAPNQITIEEQDLPSDYSLDQHTQVVTPAQHAGLRHDFKLHAVRSAGGQLIRATRGKNASDTDDVRDEVAELTDEKGRKAQLTVHADDTFYIEDLPEGAWSGLLVEQTGKHCHIRLVVPLRHEPYLDLGDVYCVKD